MGNCSTNGHGGAKGQVNNAPTKFAQQPSSPGGPPSKLRFDTSGVAPSQIDVNMVASETEKLSILSDEHLHEQWKVGLLWIL